MTPLIFAETYMNPLGEGKSLIDYKLYCFNGVPLYIQVIKNRGADETIDFYDRNWIKQSFTGVNPMAKMSTVIDETPYTFEEMKTVASKLSKGLPFVRVDLYEINRKIYFGELTLYPSGGFGFFNPQEYNLSIGNLLNIKLKT